MTAYREKAIDAVNALSAEHFDQYSLFSNFDAMDALGVWADDFHLNFSGARFTERELTQRFLIPFEV
ncbi:MAG: hypothetical protein CMN81_06390 [Spongiibacter sp.]|nr:hypothetical protein [Spongiibacter sp.]